MRKTKELLRLRFELGLGQRQIARSCGMGVGTVHRYLARAVAAEIGWPLPEGLSEEELEAKLFGNQLVRAKAVRGRPQPDWKAIHEQLQQHRHLTLHLVWEEYRHRLSSVFCLSAHFEVGLSRKQLAESMTNLRIVINYQHPFRHRWDSKVEVNPDNVVQAIKMGVGCGTDEVMLG